MKSPRYIIPLIAVLALSNVSAAPKGKGVSQQAALDKIKQQDAAKTQMAQQYYNDVSSANPGVTVGTIKKMSPDDVRGLYVKTYTAQGMPRTDALKKAADLKIFGKASGGVTASGGLSTGAASGTSDGMSAINH